MARNYGSVNDETPSSPLLQGESAPRVKRTTLFALLAVAIVAGAIGVGLGVGMTERKDGTAHPRSIKAAVPASTRAANPIQLAAREGTVDQCVNGRLHTLSYNTVGLADTHFVDMDHIDHIKRIVCDVDHTTLRLEFHSEVYSVEWYAKINVENIFLTGGTKWNCDLKNKGSVIIRRTISAHLSGASIKVHAVEARYDEIYEDADLAYSSSTGCGELSEGEVRSDSNVARFNSGFDKHICAAFNSKCDGQATQPLPLYQNQFLTITCSDCFLSFDFDAFMHIKMEGWAVKQLEAGYKNMDVKGSLVFDLQATAQWSTGVDKTIALVKSATIFSFAIGPIPFSFFFDVPVEMRADASFMATAEATVGSQVDWNIGDSYVTWDSTNHWQHVKTKATSQWTPTVTKAEAHFDATATFAVVPTLAFHLDKVFTYRLTLDPELDMEVKGDTKSKQVCADMTYDIKLTSETEMDINFLGSEDDWTWGPNVIYDSGSQTIAQKCISP
eukprot:m.477323 g.477323  ORF g.477323 m.477323 type:complete len:500 (-) comp20808_c0_seq1:247-1746(-)